MSVWQEIWQTVLSEFSDIPDVEQATRITLRLLMAAILGGLLGSERELSGKAAGLRTHILVAIGSTVFILVPQQTGVPAADLSRVMQGVVAGVGFLGAGAIIMGSNKEKVTGLTTAASIWITAAIGVTIGVGREATALLSTLLALSVLSTIPWIARLFQRATKKRKHAGTE